MLNYHKKTGGLMDKQELSYESEVSEYIQYGGHGGKWSFQAVFSS